MSYAEDPASFTRYGPLHDGPGGPLLALSIVRADGDRVVAAIDGVVDRTAAERLRGKRLFVPRKSLPEAGEDSFYHHDLVGLAAHDEAGASMGVVASVANYGAGDIIEVALPNGRRVPVAFSKAFVPIVDLAGRHIVIVRAALDDVGDGDGEAAS